MKELKDRPASITIWLRPSIVEALESYMPEVTRSRAAVVILEKDPQLMKMANDIEGKANGKRI